MSTSLQQPTTEQAVDLTPEMLFGGNETDKLHTLFLLDRSYSMLREPIQEVNGGIDYYANFIKANPVASRRIETTVISFGGNVTTHCEHASAEDLQPPHLIADGGTPMGEAILTALEILEERKQYYKDNNIGYIKPIIIALTDGMPTDADTFEAATDDLLIAEAQDQVSFTCFGCNGADISQMEAMGTKHPPVNLKDVNIEKFFQKVSVVVSGPLDDGGQIPVEKIIEESMRDA